jgi:4-diphosphocytidyl-2-C-methyl-D-erythritol kinase
MLVFPNCKINLGLYVTDKRPDGFHNLRTVFYPIQWCDVLEVLPDTKQQSGLKLSLSGINVGGKLENNILYKTYDLLGEHGTLPAIKAHLHKILPMGAGLGGGSSDAVFFMNALIELTGWNISLEQKLKWAVQLGSDCPFFVLNTPQLASGRGEIMLPLDINLKNYATLLVFPNIHSNTKVAFKGLIPKPNITDLKQFALNNSPKNWSNILTNDFETTIFKAYPEIEALKAHLYKEGALYASLSGSGSTVYGIFEKKKTIHFPNNYLWHWELNV